MEDTSQSVECLCHFMTTVGNKLDTSKAKVRFPRGGAMVTMEPGSWTTKECKVVGAYLLQEGGTHYSARESAHSHCGDVPLPFFFKCNV